MSENVSRARQFKNQGKGGEDGRRKRADASVELRKLKKEDQLMKRRNVTDTDLDEPTSPLQERSQNVSSPSVTQFSMEQIISAVNGPDPDKRMAAVQSARKILSRERNPPISDFINAGLVPHLVRFLECSDNTALQFESAWALTNIASGTSEQTLCVVKAGAVSRFVMLLKSPEENVCEQAVWALGNIAGDGAQLRDTVIDAGAVEPLLLLARHDAKVTFLRNLTWTLSNLCRNKNPPPSFETCCKCLPAFAQLLCHDDKEVLSDACWALSYISDGSNEQIQAVLDSGVLPRLVQLLYHDDSLVITPSLRAIGNIVTGNDAQTQIVVDTSGALQAFPALLCNAKPSIKKEAAWAVSNITAGSQTQIQAVIDANIMPSVIDLMEKGDFKSQKEAVWVVTNLTSGGTMQQIGYMLELGVLKPLVDLLTSKDAKTTLVVLDAINNIMVAVTKYDDQVREQVAIAFEEYGGLDKLELLQEHDNLDIYNYAQRLIDDYFTDDTEVSDLAPSQQSDQFTFTAPDESQSASSGFKF